MNRQRQIVVTVTYNELGIIIDTKAEPWKKGKWNTDKESPEYATCSVCGHCDWDCTESEYFNYCPNCGAEMEKGEDDDTD